MFFSIPSKDLIRKYAFRVAPKIAMKAMILTGLIIIRPMVGQLIGRFVSVEPQLPPVSDSHCPKLADYSHPLDPEPGGRSSLNLQDMSMCAAVVGPFAYSFLFLDISISQDEKEQVRAILMTIIKCTFSLATEIVREYVGRSLRMAAYPVKTVWSLLRQTLRAHLETIPMYLGFPAYLGMTTRLLFSMIKELKLVTFCLFFFGLGIVVALPCYHSQSFSTYVHFTSCDLSLVASDLTDRAEALFATTTKLNSVLTIVLFSLGLQFLVRSLLSSIAFISYHNKKDRKLQPKASLLMNNDEKQVDAIEDKSLAESDEDTLCDDETNNLKVDDAGEDESERDVSSQLQKAVSLPNGDKEDSLKQWHEPVISSLSSAMEDSKHASSSAHSLSFCTSPDSSISLQQQQIEKLCSPTRSYKSSLSASSPEFIPWSRNTAVCAPIQGYCPPYWALASPVTVRITVPVKCRRIKNPQTSCI